MSPSTSTRATTSVPTLESLGVRPIINGQGTYTILGGSRALPQVAEAMLLGTEHYVQMCELMEAVGARLAELTGAEWGYVASGCAAALAELAAACVAGADPEKMARLPDTTGMRDEIVIQRAHRNAYDRSLRMCGARLVEVVSYAELCSALSERTALVAITGDQAHLGEIPVETMIALARARGIPCLVDAAAERPDIPNRYLALGADAVTYSGGKCLRGPQASGLVLGRKDLLRAAYYNGAPFHSLGRPMKAGKEEILGLLAAVEAWVAGRDHAAEWRQWEAALETIRCAVADIPSVETAIEQPGIANVTPTLAIRWDAGITGGSPAWVHEQLWQGEPRIAVHQRADGIAVNPYMLEEGEAAIIARQLAALLAQPPAPAAVVAPAAPVCDLTGEWLVRIRYLLGESTHALTLAVEGTRLTGNYRSAYETAPLLSGAIDGAQVAFSLKLGYQSNRIPYAFRGQVSDGQMQGTVTLGEYPEARWQAERVR